MAKPGKVTTPADSDVMRPRRPHHPTGTRRSTSAGEDSGDTPEHDTGAIERSIRSVRDLIDRSSNTTQALCGHADRLLGGRDEGENDANCAEASDAGQMDTLRRLLSLLSVQQTAVEREVIRFEEL